MGIVLAEPREADREGVERLRRLLAEGEASGPMVEVDFAALIAELDAEEAAIGT